MLHHFLKDFMQICLLNTRKQKNIIFIIYTHIALEPSRSYSMFYGWHSIIFVRSLVSNGLIKMVGSGSSISVSNDPWFSTTRPRPANNNQLNLSLQEIMWIPTTIFVRFSSENIYSDENGRRYGFVRKKIRRKSVKIFDDIPTDYDGQISDGLPTKPFVGKKLSVICWKLFQPTMLVGIVDVRKYRRRYSIGHLRRLFSVGKFRCLASVGKFQRQDSVGNF